MRVENFKKLAKGFSGAALAVAFSLGTANTAQAVPVGTEFDLDGIFTSTIHAVHRVYNLPTNYNVSADFSNAHMIYTGTSLQLYGTVDLCVGAAGADCFGADPFSANNNVYAYNNRIYLGAGTFDIAAEIDLDLTRGDDNDFFANMDPEVGSLTLRDAADGIDPNINLALKANPTVGYALRAFLESQDPDIFRINAWLQLFTDSQAQGGILGGYARGESLRGEAVFNFNGDGFTATPTNVPEPFTAGLLSLGLLGGGLVRKKKAKA